MGLRMTATALCRSLMASLQGVCRDPCEMAAASPAPAPLRRWPGLP